MQYFIQENKDETVQTLIQPVVTCGAETWTIKCNILYKRTKMKLYKTLLQPVVTCGAETWTIKCNILSKRTKIKLHKTVIRPIVTCGTETWTIKSADEQHLSVFERKTFHRISGPVFIDGE